MSLLNGLITVGYIDVGVDLGAGENRGPTAAQNHANCSAAGLWTIASADVCAAAAQTSGRTRTTSGTMTLYMDFEHGGGQHLQVQVGL